MPLPSLNRRTLIEIDDEEVDELPPDILDEVAPLFREHVTARLSLIASSNRSWMLNRVAIYDGDCHITGSLDTIDDKLSVLVVHGDLVVDGCFGDSNHPESFTYVTGSLRARDVIAEGYLEVRGNLVASRALIGNGVACAAWIAGDVTCDLFYPEKYGFDVAGTFAARGAFGPDSKLTAPAMLTAKTIHDFLDPALVRVDEHGGFEVDCAKLKHRIRGGESIGPR